MSATPIQLESTVRARSRLGQALRELWACRTTTAAFAERHLRVMRKQAVLGVAWAMRQRLAFLPIFGGVARAVPLPDAGRGVRRHGRRAYPADLSNKRDVFREWQAP